MSREIRPEPVRPMSVQEAFDENRPLPASALSALDYVNTVANARDEAEELLRQAVRIIARIENERGIPSREGQDFLGRARKVLTTDT